MRHTLLSLLLALAAVIMVAGTSVWLWSTMAVQHAMSAGTLAPVWLGQAADLSLDVVVFSLIAFVLLMLTDVVLP